MKRVIVAALIAVLGVTSCTQQVIGFVPPAWGGVSEKTTLEDVASIVKPDEILSAALNAGTDDTGSIWYEAVSGTSSASGISSAFTITPRTSEGYQIIVHMNSYIVSGEGSISGTITYDVSYDSAGNSASYTTASSSLTVVKEGTTSSLSATVSDFAGTVSSITITAEADTVSISVTSSTTVTPDRFSGSYESGSETIQGSESEGLGNGSEESPYVLSSSGDLAKINDFGNDVYFELGYDAASQVVVTASGITLDLNGYSISYPDGIAITVNGGDLTLLDSVGGSIVSGFNAVVAIGDGKVTIMNGTYRGEKGSAVLAGWFDDAEPVVIENGHATIYDGDFYGYEGCLIVWGDSSMTVYDGEFSSDFNIVVMTQGNALLSSYRYELNLLGGTYTGTMIEEGRTGNYLAGGVYLANTGDTVIDGAVFNIDGGVGVTLRAGNLTLEDMTFNHTAIEGVENGKIGDSKVLVPAGEAIVIDVESGYPGEEPGFINHSDYEAVDPDGNPFVQGLN